MNAPDPVQTLPEDRMRDLFAQLVAAQDAGEEVTASRERIARENELTVTVVKNIEGRGLAESWPPLGTTLEG